MASSSIGGRDVRASAPQRSRPLAPPLRRGGGGAAGGRPAPAPPPAPGQRRPAGRRPARAPRSAWSSRAGTPRARAGPSSGWWPRSTPATSGWPSSGCPPTTSCATTSCGGSGRRCRAGAAWPSSTAPGTAGSWSSGWRSWPPRSSGAGPTTRSPRSRSRWPKRAWCIIKLWMHISHEEQLRRFESRRDDPLKRWKLTDEDWRNREKRPAYEAAVEDMLAYTDHPQARWDVIPAEQKRYGRVAALADGHRPDGGGHAPRGIEPPPSTRRRLRRARVPRPRRDGSCRHSGGVSHRPAAATASPSPSTASRWPTTGGGSRSWPSSATPTCGRPRPTGPTASPRWPWPPPGHPRCSLGVAIAPAYTRGPALLAQTVAAMAEAAPGRFTFGLGASSDVIVERWNGIAFAEPYSQGPRHPAVPAGRPDRREGRRRLRHLRRPRASGWAGRRPSRPRSTWPPCGRGMLRLAGRRGRRGDHQLAVGRRRAQGGGRGRTGQGDRGPHLRHPHRRRRGGPGRRPADDHRLPQRPGLRRVPPLAGPGPAARGHVGGLGGRRPQGRPGRRARRGGRRTWSSTASPDACREHVARYVANGVTIPALAVIRPASTWPTPSRGLAPVG